MAEIKNTDDFEKWLAARPEETHNYEARALAARCALWVLPQLNYDKRSNDEFSERLFLTNRCLTISWAASTYPAHEMVEYAISAADNVVAAVSAIDDDVYVNAEGYAPIYTATYAASFSTRAVIYTFNTDAPAFSANAAGHASDALWKALSQDCTALEDGTSIEEIITSRLWRDKIPEEINKNWQALKQELTRNDDFKDQNWDVWIRWYEDRLHGRPANEALEIARATLPDKLWEQGAKAVNSRILELEAQHNKDNIPALKPASVMPEWRGNKLFQSLPIATAEQLEDVARAKMEALADDFTELAKSLESDTNLDRRIPAYIRATVPMFEKDALTLPNLMKLNSRESFLFNYLSTAKNEWPDFLYQQFQHICGELNKTLNVFNEINKFNRAVQENQIDPNDFDFIDSFANEMVILLRSKEMQPYIDASVPDAIEQMTQYNLVIVGGQESYIEGSDGTKLKLAADKLEGLNNLAKRLALARDSDKVLGLFFEGFKAYQDGIAKNYVENSRKAGEEDSLRLAKIANRGATGIGILATVYQGLSKRFPNLFKWLGNTNDDED